MPLRVVEFRRLGRSRRRLGFWTRFGFFLGLRISVLVSRRCMGASGGRSKDPSFAMACGRRRKCILARAPIDFGPRPCRTGLTPRYCRFSLPALASSSSSSSPSSSSSARLLVLWSLLKQPFNCAVFLLQKVVHMPNSKLSLSSPALGVVTTYRV
jgi:hypothetical protein